MNIEEMQNNKPKGATHYDIYGDWWMINGDVAHFMFKGRGGWTRYAFTDIQKYVAKGDVKPL